MEEQNCNFLFVPVFSCSQKLNFSLEQVHVEFVFFRMHLAKDSAGGFGAYAFDLHGADGLFAVA
jgi:hypothetical protein